MSDQPQTIVEPSTPPDKAMGARNEINMRSSFPSSPIYKNELNDDERKKVFQKLVLDGTVVNGLGLNTFNRDFEGAPDLKDVETGGGGKPSSPYGPNLTSPGAGSVNASDQPPFEGTLPNVETNIEFGSGLPSSTSPSQTTKPIASQSIIGGYISGRSYQGSDGKA